MKHQNRIFTLRKITLATALSTLLFCGCSYAQQSPPKTIKVARGVTVSRSSYKLYVNKQQNFQFEINAAYKLVPSGDGENYTIEAVTKADKEIYEDYNNIVYSLKVQKQSLEESIEGDFEKGNDGEYYFKGVLSDSLKKATKITGNGFTGLKKVISCRVNSGQDSTVVDGCETVYLSNGKLTLSFTTSGIAIDDEDLDKIIKSLKFNN